MNCNEPCRCRWWSERIAKYDDDRGEVLAICLHRDSHRYGQFTSAGDGCRLGEEGEPIDLESVDD